MKGDGMKIVVIGGTGLIGSKLVERLDESGHDAVPASPDSGVDTYTGQGLEEALEGAQVVVDVSNHVSQPPCCRDDDRGAPPRSAVRRGHRPIAG
jgi:uncharacterized protein YbjT (DUF2867 family)